MKNLKPILCKRCKSVQEAEQWIETEYPDTVIEYEDGQAQVQSQLQSTQKTVVNNQAQKEQSNTLQNCQNPEPKMLITPNPPELNRKTQPYPYQQITIDEQLFQSKSKTLKPLQKFYSYTTLSKDQIAKLQIAKIKFAASEITYDQFQRLASEGTVYYTDGGSSPNPGSSGFGVVCFCQNCLKYSLSFGFSHSTNNRMELLSVLTLLQNVRGVDLTIGADSQYVINSLTKWIQQWIKGGVIRSDVKNQDLVKLLAIELAQNRKIQFCYLKGHSGNAGNEAADSASWLFRGVGGEFL